MTGLVSARSPVPSASGSAGWSFTKRKDERDETLNKPAR